MVAYPISEGRVPLLHGKWVSPSRDGYPLSPDGYPYCEGGLSVPRGTATPFPKAVGPRLKDMYPCSEGVSLSPLARDCGTPFQRDWHQIRTLLHPSAVGRMIPLRKDGPRNPRDGGAVSEGRIPVDRLLLTFFRSTRTPFSERRGNPSSGKARYGNPSPPGQ